MFAPSSVNLPRTVHAHTGRKNVNKENAGALPSKTPSRAPGKLIPSASARIGLGVKTVERDRNVHVPRQEGEGTGKGKGKDHDDIGTLSPSLYNFLALNHDPHSTALPSYISHFAPLPHLCAASQRLLVPSTHPLTRPAPKRLFASTTKTIPPSKSLSQLPYIPNTHRTPAPTRRQPPPTTLKHTLRTPAPVSHLDSGAGLATTTPLPSATRHRRRSSRQSLTPLKSQQGERDGDKSFVTPAPTRWEEEVSLDSIHEVFGAGLDEVAEVAEVEEESDGEVEYMPPKVQELPWEPAWEYPPLEPIFERLKGLPPLWGLGYEESLNKVVKPFDVEPVEEGSVKLCPEAELEDPLFRTTVAEVPPVAAKPAPVVIARPTPSAGARPTPSAGARPTLSAGAKPTARGGMSGPGPRLQATAGGRKVQFSSAANVRLFGEAAAAELPPPQPLVKPIKRLPTGRPESNAAAASRTASTSTSRPAHISTSRPASTSTSRPMPTINNRPPFSATSRPVPGSASRPPSSRDTTATRPTPASRAAPGRPTGAPRPAAPCVVVFDDDLVSGPLADDEFVLDLGLDPELEPAGGVDVDAAAPASISE
nr:NAC domain [Naematelia aurantialba]